MKIKALRTLRGDAGNIRRDAEADVSDAVGKSLIARGLAVEVEGEAEPRRKPPKARGANKPKAKTATKGAAAPKTGE